MERFLRRPETRCMVSRIFLILQLVIYLSLLLGTILFFFLVMTRPR
ncbi:MAG: hypothetical protein NQU46_07830 [Methanolinea sp.]|nr:hypothetical protein [Methanolinea sp.]